MSKFTTLEDVFWYVSHAKMPFMIAIPPIHVYKMNTTTRLHLEHLYREYQIEKAKIAIVNEIGFVPDTVEPLNFKELGYLYGFPIVIDDTLEDDDIVLSYRDAENTR